MKGCFLLCKKKIRKLTENNELKFISQLSEESKNIIEDVKNTCKRVGEFLIAHTEIFEYTTVKLYSIAYNAEDKDFEKYFEWFCEDQWLMFEEWVKENNLTLNYIGRTSSFYFDSDYSSVNDSLSMLRNDYRRQNFTDSFELGVDFLQVYWNDENNYNGLDVYTLIDNTKLEEYITYHIEQFDYTIEDEDVEIYESFSDFSQYVNKCAIPALNDIIKGYEYLNTLKDNELDIWNEYVDFQKETNPDYFDEE